MAALRPDAHRASWIDDVRSGDCDRFSGCGACDAHFRGPVAARLGHRISAGALSHRSSGAGRASAQFRGSVKIARGLCCSTARLMQDYDT